ncbi:MAG: ABC transporter permease [Lachnospiraceae bacterium]|nr:ABC transporter permease [Lachnospiraceae bacterium]
MLSIPLLKRTVKSNYKLWTTIVVILTLFMLLIVGMFSPGLGARVASLMAGLPTMLLTALGFDMGAVTLTGHLASCLFGFLFLVFPMIYETVTANRLVARQVETGRMGSWLSTPNPRKKIATTQAYYLIMSLFVMFLFTTVLGLVCCRLWFPGELGIPQFMLLNLGAFCLHIFLSGISFLASCISDDTRTSLMIGAGLPVLFYLIRMLSNIGGGMEILRFFTVFTLFSPKAIMEGSVQICWSLPLLALAGLGMYWAGIALFEKRDLPL